MVLNLGQLCSQFAKCGRTFGYHMGGRYGWQLVAVGQGCYKHPTVHKTGPSPKHYQPQMSVALRLRKLPGVKVKGICIHVCTALRTVAVLSKL